MRRCRTTRWSAFVAAAALAATTTLAPTAEAQQAAPATRAAGNAREAALQDLAGRLDLPLVDEAVAIFSVQLRRSLPSYLVDAAGRNIGLPGWRPGNATFDEALRELDRALAADEARRGPLLKLERTDLLLAVNVPWTVDDIAFVRETLPTDLGHEAERALDAKAAQQTIATLRRRVATGPNGAGIAAAYADLDARAQARFGDALLMLLAMKAADPVRVQRLQRLVEAVTVAPSDAIGQRVVDRLSRRLIDAAADELPGIVNGVVNGQTRR